MKYHCLLLISCACLLYTCGEEDLSAPLPPTTCELTDDQKAVVEELNNGLAYTFSSAEPEEDSPQLDPLIDFLGDAPFVGLGEGTHGTAEFYQMKDKIFRRLVTEKDFKAIVFEIPWGNAMVVNDYVMNGVGTANSAINQTYYWTYDTGEVRVLAKWMHDYNDGRPEHEKVYFAGCDVQGSDFAEEQRIVTQYLQQVAPELVEEILEHYNQLPSNDLFDYASAEVDVHQANITGTEAAYNRFVSERDNWIALSSELEYEIARMAAHVIQQREYVYRTGNYGVVRDSLMAVYSQWWQQILGAEAKVAIWAHNFHVMDASYYDADWMGTYLRQWHPLDYKNVGFSFGQGSFNAFVAGSNGQFQSGVTTQSLSEPECGTTNHVLTAVEGDQYYLIFKDLSGSARQYFSAEKPFLQCGAGFNKNYTRNYIRDFRLSSLFDVLIHFDETVASDLQ